MGSLESSDTMDPDTSYQHLDAMASQKPLPPAPPPFDRTASEAPVLGPANQVSVPSAHVTRPSLSSGDSFLRPKKRVIWRNRSCIIALPVNSDFGRSTTRENYLTPEDVVRRLQEWEDKGYDTRGFMLAPPAIGFLPSFSESQSREEIYPDLEEVARSRSERNYRVNILDRREWEAYVEQLKEEKLRSLGVSCGDDDSPSKSPATAAMSRQASSQNSAMLTSPAVNAQSMHGMSFPPGPSHHLGKISASHSPRYSVAMPHGERPFSPSNHFARPSQSPIHNGWSPQQCLGSRPGSRVASPNAVGHTQKINGSVSPLPSSIQNSIRQVSNEDSDETLKRMQQQLPLLKAPQYRHQQQQPMMQSYPLSAKMQLVLLASANHANIASPVPHVHHQLPRETLQSQVDGPRLSQGAPAIPKPTSHQWVVGEQNPSGEIVATGTLTREDAAPVSRVAVSNTKAQSRIPDTSELNRGRESLSQREDFPKASGSKLNVNAPEFIFEPNKPIEEEPVAFLDNKPAENIKEDAATTPAMISAHKMSSADEASHTTKLNVTAPEFKPRAIVRKPTVPSREFSFSASLPTLRPSAPTFQPSDPHTTSGSDQSNKENSVDAVKKIFGEIKFSEATKPAKKSKAIPIIRPNENLESPEKSAPNSDGQEDESGRITRADGMQKRMRRDFDNGDQVPLFASPNQNPLTEHGDSDRAAYSSRSPSIYSDKANNATLEAATDLLEEIIDDLSATEASDLLREDESTSADGKPFEPHSFHDIDDASTLNAARPLVSPRGHTSRHLDPTPDDVARATMDFLAKSPQYKADFDEALECCLPDSQPRLQQNPEEDDGIDRIDYASQDIMKGVRYIEPSYNEIDAIMKHLNEDSDFGVERRPSPFKRRGLSMSPVRSSAPELHHTSRSPIRDSTIELYEAPKTPRLRPPANPRSEAPSPSPNRLRGLTQYMPPTDSESANTSAIENIEQIARDIARHPLDSPSWPTKNPIPVHRLNSLGSSPPSDWNDAISSLDGDKLRSRTGFFDNRVNDLVGNVVQQRLGPLAKAVSGIQESLAALSRRSASRRPRSSGTVEAVNSDADDEEDIEEPSQTRLKSPLRDRKVDQPRLTINDLTAAQQNLPSAIQLTEVMGAVKELKESMSQAPSTAQSNANDIRIIVEEAVGKQLRGRSAPVTSSSVAAVAEKSQLQIAGLESMLKVAENRADDELKARRSIEDALADNQRLLRSALQEASEQRESAEATERTLEEYSEERQEMLQRNAMLERSEENLQTTIVGLSDKNAAMEDTLAEYRLSSDQWRTEIDDARHDNKDLQRRLNSLRTEVDESNEHRQALRAKLNALQEEISRALQEAAGDRLKWHGKEQENDARLETLSGRLEAEARARDRLQFEVELQEQEATRARSTIEQMRTVNDQLQSTVNELKSESMEYQQAAARFKRELHDVRESNTLEVQRARNAMTADVEAANNQVRQTRVELESVIAGLRQQIEGATADVSDGKARHDLMLEEASDSRSAALREAADAREAALHEHHRFHERTIGDLKAQNERTVNNAMEDKQRSETYFGNRLSLADEKVVHYQDRVKHLEEKLQIAKSAAHAAVQAAQSKNAANPVSVRSTHSITGATNIPEKISPQALRESILVLQEQLQERESRIEQLESELSCLDATAPAKIKDAEIEITWLRELLGVRIDDLEDIISTLSRPAYNREAVKDAAIRLKANLQMEQQEKECALAGGQSFPSLSSISTLAASPKALPLAAAAAWGNWRNRGREGFGNLSALANGSVQQQTPSKSSPQSFFAGLMTPPNTNVRTTPPIDGDIRPLSSLTSKRVAQSHTTPRQKLNSRNEVRLQQDPVTPPLMRKASYDLDASESISGFGDEGVEGNKMAGEDDEPFGPRLGGIVRGM